MNTAEMAGREFDAEKWNVKLLDAQTRQVVLNFILYLDRILNIVSWTPCCKVYIDTGGEEKPGLTAEQTKLRVPRRPNWIGLSPEQLKEVKLAPYSAKSTVVDLLGGKSEFLGLEERAGSAPRGNWGCGDSLREELGVLEAIVESDRAQ